MSRLTTALSFIPAHRNLPTSTRCQCLGLPPGRTSRLRPQLAADTLRQRQVMGVVGRTLLELACKLQRSDMETRRLMEFKPRRKQPCHHADAVADVQLPPQHPPVESVGDLEGHEVRGDADYVPGNPGL